MEEQKGEEGMGWIDPDKAMKEGEEGEGVEESSGGKWVDEKDW